MKTGVMMMKLFQQSSRMISMMHTSLLQETEMVS